MPDFASLALLFVAAGLLVLAGTRLGRTRAPQPSARRTAVMAGMTGTALGFLLYVMWVPPLILFPIVVAVIIVADWLARGELVLLGSFLVGAGGLWAGLQGLSLINDLGDEAVTTPGWTPIPLALGVAVTVLGAALVVATRQESRPRPR